MQILRTASDLPSRPRNVCVAIGVFDGVHLGHQEVIRQTLSDARQQNALAVVITFDRHPSSVVAPERTPPLIYSLPQKLRTIESLGAEAVLLIHFDTAFSQKTGEQFISELSSGFGHIQSLCVGTHFTFGYRRSGNVELLRRLGAEQEFIVHGLPAVEFNGQTVSSTRIRETIRSGDLERAGQLLGRPYALAAQVIKGDQLGRTLGFPTANLEVTGLVVPPHGVYAIQALHQGRTLSGVLNIGLRPTLQNPLPQLRVEAHLLDFSGDLYGEELEITFVRKLREEQRFPSLSALQEQIGRDIAGARKLFQL